MVKSQKPCKDCIAEGIATRRPTPHPGPRCVTHWRAVVMARKYSAHARRVEATFGLTDEQYWAIYAFQQNRCAICQRATGRAKHLAVDHDHRCQAGHPPDQGCRECWRGLLCGPCNQLLGRYDPEALQRALDYLTDPPAQQVLSS